MKVALVTSGSRGDVQPYILLGLEIQQRGHTVVIATEKRMEPLVQQLGKGRAGYACIAGDPTAMLFDKKCQVRDPYQQYMQLYGAANSWQLHPYYLVYGCQLTDCLHNQADVLVGSHDVDIECSQYSLLS